MPNIFKSDTEGPICPFAEATAATIAGVGTGYYGFYNCPLRITELAFKSTLDTEVELFLQNPADPAQTKWFWMKIAANETFAMQSNMPPQIWLPARTWIWVRAVSALPTSGKLSVFAWGG